MIVLQSQSSTPKITNITENQTMFPFFNSFFFFFFFICLCFLCFSRPAFPARILPDSVPVLTDASDVHNATWHDFSRFLDAGRGSLVSGMSELKNYMHRFGYLPNSNFTDFFDTEFESALTLYQSKLSLPVTGKLDTDTISAIISPRCGVSDASQHTALHATRHFAYFYGKPRWERPSPLTYAFSPNHTVSYLNPSDVRDIFCRAFSGWSAVIPMNFTETQNYTSADIKIGFYRGDHGDGKPFDGVLGVLAHAFSPENGQFHLDAAESWAVDFKTDKSKEAIDLESVATHEIGHVLGLAHSSVKEAVMYPSLRPRTKKVNLRVDDVEGVQALYGSNPNFRFSSLLNENFYNHAVSLDPRSSSKCSISLTLTITLVLILGLWQPENYW